MGCFSINLGISTSIFAKFAGAISTMEYAFAYNWNNLWLESDSTLVVQALQTMQGFPWKLRTRWANCILKFGSNNIRISNIFREGNCCADKLASMGAQGTTAWWPNVPNFIVNFYGRDLSTMPFYRFR
ncbi:hypothetical protein BVC80_1373g13 [Macleaya cordata]|uniref:RNase H type-1 domain-containing protein n=1 Tax=Macleaya cordata TaxID=56857 RepID=A0A200QQR3_MACCD|nr:hypothetical protein BVC80_1373g13 [Macleaya cordata]